VIIPFATGFDYTPMGFSDVVASASSADIGVNEYRTVLSSNLLDLMSDSNKSTAYFTSGAPFNDPTDLILGPKVNSTSLGQYLNVTLESCDPLFYSRSTFLDNSVRNHLYWNASFVPVVQDTPYNNGVRFKTFNFN